MLFNLKAFKNTVKKTLSNFDFLDFLFRKFYVNIFKFLFLVKFKKVTVKENSFLFECFRGKMVNDSPISIYNYLTSRDFQGEYTWVLSSIAHPMYKYLKNKEDTNVVIYGTDEYYRAYATSQYWIVNCRIPLRIVKKATQKFVQCWHGTPLKKLGCDIESDYDARISQTSLKYVYSIEAKQIDYFISPSEYASKCFVSSFGLKRNQILQLGYPRNDAIFNGSSDLCLIKKLRVSLNIPVEATVILYAPTYRDNSFSNKQQKHVLNNPLENKEFLNNFTDDVVFLYRGHYFTALEGKSSRFIDVSSYDNVNDLYLISDLLITDYSSVFFDYSILNKPTLFFMYDREEYELKIRGFYLNVDVELPGKICKSQSSLADNILENLEHEHDLSYFNVIYNPYEDGLSTQRVVNAIIDNTNATL